MNEAKYYFNNEEYLVTATEEFHNKMSTDQKFREDYFRKACSEEHIEEYSGDLNVSNTFTWDKNTTKYLIQQYKDRKDRFRDPTIKKKTLWLEIKSKFADIGYDINEDLLIRKWRNLKKTYTAIRDNIKSTGRGRISWDYYHDFNEIYFVDKTVNLPLTLSSLPTTENNNNQSLEIKLSSDTQPQAVPPKMLTISELSKSPFPIGEAVDNATSLLQPSKVQPTPKLSKNNRRTGLYYLKKRNAEIEEKRVEEIKLLRLAVERNNEIQLERNSILKELVRNKKPVQ